MNELSDIVKLAPPVALALGLNLVGLVLRKSAYINNKHIPLILLLAGGITYPFVAETSKIAYDIKHPEVLLAIYGLCIGGLSVGLNQVFRQYFPSFGNDDEGNSNNKPQQ